MQLEVVGLPAPQGSKRVFINKATGRPVMKESSDKKVDAWREAIAHTVRDYLERLPAPPMTGPLSVRLSFRFPAVASDPHRYWHAVRPDIDKITRSTLDGLTYSGLIADDSVISKLAILKRYVVADETVGCTIEIENLAGEEAEIRETRKQRAARDRQRQVDDKQERLLA